MNNDLNSQAPDTQALENELQQTIAQVLRQANTHLESGQIEAAESLYRAILEILPEHPEANYNLGLMAIQARQPKLALPHLRTAVTSQPEREEFWLEYIDALIQAEHFEAASQALELGRRHGLKDVSSQELVNKLNNHQFLVQDRQDLQPTPAPSPTSLSTSDTKSTPSPAQTKTKKIPSRKEINKLDGLRKKGRTAAIESFARELIVRFPEHGLGWKTLGGMLDKQGLTSEAIAPLQKAVELMPEDPEVHNDLGTMLYKTARYTEAEFHLNKALELKPDFVTALSNLGNLLRVQGKLIESEKHLARALGIDPNATLYNNLGVTLLELNRIVEAETCYRRALKIKPDFALARINLGVCLRKQGRLSEAIEHQRRALKLESQSTELHSNLLFTLNYMTGSTNLFHLEEALQYGRMVKKKVKEPFSSWHCTAEPERLRIGFVSGDLYNHPVGFFLESILDKLDTSRIELIAYPTTAKNDDLTQRLKKHFKIWKPLCGLSDEAAARMIHEDGVHVLYDLAGHTGHNRLPLFVWKPAPVQASWLGYFATTGMSEIDFFLTDAVGVPESQKENFTETLWYLPDTRLCFTAPNVDIPVTQLPALTNGYITFGCFQQLTKIGDDLLVIWKEIFSALPNSRLRWQCRQFSDPEVIEKIKIRLHRFNIDPSRIVFHGSMHRAQYLAAHSEVDLILDTFPYPGGTTTCEALWMGVPTITLSGNSLLSRQGASLLTAAGLQEWIANSEEEYVQAAVAMASDLEKLAGLRTALRNQVVKSPLFEAERFARNFEAASWGMWEERQPPKRLMMQTQTGTASEDKPIMNFFSPVFWGTKDPRLFTDLMRKAAEQTSAYHFGDNMFLFQRNNSMLNDQPFMKAWEGNVMTDPDRTIIWRRYILAMAGFHCQHLEGDFVECGAYQGTGAKTVIDYLGGREFKKTFWLYDLFEHNENMVHHSMQAHGPQLYNQVVERFKNYPNVKIFKGFLPDVLEQGCPEKIAYLHLDLNQAPAEIATLDALFDRVVPGGMIILDDYEMVFYRSQKLAEDVWFGERGYKVFPLPTSQGFVIKR